MKRIIPIVFAGVFFLLTTQVFAAEPVQLPAGTLNTDEILRLFSGKTVESFNVSNQRVSQTYYNPDGTVVQLRDGKKRFGKWKVKEKSGKGRICLKIENGRNKCRIVVKDRGTYRKYVVKLSGKHRHVIDYRSFVAGNPYNLWGQK